MTLINDSAKRFWPSLKRSTLNDVTVWMPFTHTKSEADQTQSSHDLNQLCGLNTAAIRFGGFAGFLPRHNAFEKVLKLKKEFICTLNDPSTL